MKAINPRGKLTPEDHLYLYWFNKFTQEQVDGIEEEYKKFQPTESMINNYNDYIKRWNEAFDKNRMEFEKSVDWDVTRPKTAYFKDKLQAGHTFEVWVENEFANEGINLGMFTDEEGQYAGENKFGIEIKHDMRLAETGNVYIEYKERLRQSGGWTNSGILKDDNAKYWIIGSPEEYYIFRKEDLLQLYNAIIQPNACVEGCRLVEERENQTSKGFIIKKDKAKQICVSQSIKSFVASLNEPTKYFACGWYYHRDRKCKYINQKNDDKLQVFSSEEEAITKGFKPCKNCVSRSEQ